MSERPNRRQMLTAWLVGGFGLLGIHLRGPQTEDRHSPSERPASLTSLRFDRLGRVTHYTYDGNGRLTSVTAPLETENYDGGDTLHERAS